MKRYIFLICVILICMCGCGKDTENEHNVLTPVEPIVSSTDDVGPEFFAADLGGTYWKAVRLEGEGCFEGGDEMPIGSWNADLFLNRDGTGRFRNTYGASYNYFQPECSWSYDENTSQLSIQLSDGAETFGGRVTRDGLCLYYYGNELWFEQAKMPAAGGEWCLADFVGTWKLDRVEIEDDAFNAEEAGVYGSVTFYFDDPALKANYVQYDDFGNRVEMVDTNVVYLDMPLFDGCANEVWSVEFAGGGDRVKGYAALLDRQTMVMLVEQYFNDEFEYPAVSVQYFTWEGTGAVG